MANDYLSRISIMVVDDQDFACRMLRQMLSVLNAVDVRLYTSAEKAWNEFKIRPADIVLTDWEMKPMSGLELTKLIRTDPETPNAFTPIIMVTAHREMARVFEARDVGVTEYVIKPVAPKNLFSRLEACIEKPRRFIRVGAFFGPDRRRQTKEFKGEDRRGKEPKKAPDAAAKDKGKEDSAGGGAEGPPEAKNQETEKPAAPT